MRKRKLKDLELRDLIRKGRYRCVATTLVDRIIYSNPGLWLEQPRRCELVFKQFLEKPFMFNYRAGEYEKT